MVWNLRNRIKKCEGNKKKEEIISFAAVVVQVFMLIKSGITLRMMFYDIENIAFSHAKCNYEAGTKTFVSNCKNEIREEAGLYIY